MLSRRIAQYKLSNFLVLIMSMLLLTACFSGIIPPEARVALDPAGTATGIYKRGPLSVGYSYKNRQETLQISGDIDFQYSVDSLNVRLEFLDQEGKVIGRHLVYSSGYRTSGMGTTGRSFNTVVKIPDGTTAFTFSSSEKQRTGRR